MLIFCKVRTPIKQKCKTNLKNSLVSHPYFSFSIFEFGAAAFGTFYVLISLRPLRCIQTACFS